MTTASPTILELAAPAPVRLQRLVVPVLYARTDSIYKTLEGCDVWDEVRDARKWNGDSALVAHPPCRAWGRLAHFAKPAPGEKELAVIAVGLVRKFGGVLEHPEHSRLWAEMKMPLPNAGADEHGGYTIEVDQRWWGHRANKPTWLYIVGCHISNLPQVPLRIDEGTHCIMRDRRYGRNRHKPHMPHAEREATPIKFAQWLIEVARRANGNEKGQR